VSVLTPDLDIWSAANLLIEQHGDRAEGVAAMRHADMLVDKDEAGARLWSRIRQAVVELQRKPTGKAH